MRCAAAPFSFRDGSPRENHAHDASVVRYSIWIANRPDWLRTGRVELKADTKFLNYSDDTAFSSSNRVDFVPGTKFLVG